MKPAQVVGKRHGDRVVVWAVREGLVGLAILSWWWTWLKMHGVYGERLPMYDAKVRVESSLAGQWPTCLRLRQDFKPATRALACRYNRSVAYAS